MKRLRNVPLAGTLTEVSQRCIQGRHLLTPSERFNRIASGVIGRAQQLYGMEIAGFTVLSNHYHLLVLPRDAGQLARFFNHFSSNLAREASLIHGWSGKFWAKRYTPIPVADDEPSQIRRLLYLIENGCKENLVARPADWPGLHVSKAILYGAGLEGLWIDRTELGKALARAPGSDPVNLEDFAHEKRVELEPLPCWRHLSPQQYRARVQELVDLVEEETAEAQRRQGIRVVGPDLIERRDPWSRAPELNVSPAPLIHAQNPETRRAYATALGELVAAHEEAACRFRAGERTASFPEGTFPPAPPFVAPEEQSSK